MAFVMAQRQKQAAERQAQLDAEREAFFAIPRCELVYQPVDNEDHPDYLETASKFHERGWKLADPWILDEGRPMLLTRAELDERLSWDGTLILAVKKDRCGSPTCVAKKPSESPSISENSERSSESKVRFAWSRIGSQCHASARSSIATEAPPVATGALAAGLITPLAGGPNFSQCPSSSPVTTTYSRSVILPVGSRGPGRARDQFSPTRTMKPIDKIDAARAIHADLRALGLRVEAGRSKKRGGHDLRSWFITTCQEHGAHRDLLRVVTHTAKGDIMSATPGRHGARFALK
jgi:hypothetical protein